MMDLENSLDLDALLDPERLAAAWQTARERPQVIEMEEGDEIAEREIAERELAEGDEIAKIEDATGETFAVEAPALPIAQAHQQFLDEIDRTLAAVPAIADQARRALAVPLAQLAKAIDPVDLPAAEAAIDQLEDLWQALLSTAGWPRVPLCANVA